MTISVAGTEGVGNSLLRASKAGSKSLVLTRQRSLLALAARSMASISARLIGPPCLSLPKEPSALSGRVCPRLSRKLTTSETLHISAGRSERLVC
jgi:hypothetical protein